MIALSASGIGLSFGAEDILRDISFAVNEGDRVGIIGTNGAGKTSLFRIITGEYTPDTGSVYIMKGATVGILEQNPNLTALPGGMSALEYMYTAHPTLLALEEEIAKTEALLAEAARLGHEGEAMTLSARLAEQNRQYTEGGGLEFRQRCRGMLTRLGFDEEMLTQKLSTLSGGQYTRLALARLLSTEPDILMLDEPTNHLDIDALAWLEGYLSTYKKTVLIISHDRYFLDRTTDKTLHILYGKARLYPAAYTRAKAMMEAEAEQLEHKYKEQQKEIARIRANIEFQRRCNREHNFVTIRAKEKQLARMDLVELAPKAPKDIRLSFSELEECAGDVLTVKELSFSYGGKKLINNLSFLVRSGERVMFLGPNGSGKSTLMKLINSRLAPTAGRINLGYNVKIGYYDQENRGLSENKTVFAEMHDEYPEKKDLELRSTLALFLFGAEDMDKPISTLSGGERARLTLAKLILKKVNLLVMDEPTNHLDIGSREALETALNAFGGTIVAVSHDRYFINSVATRIIELAPDTERGMLDCVLEDYDDAYAEYLALREKVRATKPEAEDKKNADGREAYEQKKRESRERRGEERKIERAKARIPKIEEELEALDAELFGDAASDYVRAAEIEAKKAELEAELMELYELTM